jgi:hypothetical protein
MSLNDQTKPVRLTAHARGRLASRGTDEKEVAGIIRNSQWQPSEGGRLECRRSFPFEKNWNNRYYKTRQARPVFIEKEDHVLVITIYVSFH